MVFLTGVDVDHGVNVGALVSEALHDCDMQHKEAYLTCGLDAAGWSRSLCGKQPLDLWKLRHMPIRWWQSFLAKLASALIKQMFSDFSTDLKMAKATLPVAKAKDKVS